jgi:hypothetical protein
MLWRTEKPRTLPENEPQFPDCPAHSLVTVLTILKENLYNSKFRTFYLGITQHSQSNWHSETAQYFETQICAE